MFPRFALAIRGCMVMCVGEILENIAGTKRMKSYDLQGAYLYEDDKHIDWIQHAMKSLFLDEN